MIPASGGNVYSYSSFRQRMTIPAGATTTDLNFSRISILGDPTSPELAPPADVLAASPDVADYHYLLAVFDDGSYQTLRTWRDNQPS